MVLFSEIRGMEGWVVGNGGSGPVPPRGRPGIALRCEVAPGLSVWAEGSEVPDLHAHT